LFTQDEPRRQIHRNIDIFAELQPQRMRNPRASKWVIGDESFPTMSTLYGLNYRSAALTSSGGGGRKLSRPRQASGGSTTPREKMSTNEFRRVGTWRKKIMAVSLIILGVIALSLFATCKRSSGPSRTQEYSGRIRSAIWSVFACRRCLAHAKGYFKDEGLDVELDSCLIPGDSTTALTGGAVQFIHQSIHQHLPVGFTGAPLKIVAGSGNGGLFCIAQPESGINNLADLKSQSKTWAPSWK